MGLYPDCTAVIPMTRPLIPRWLQALLCAAPNDYSLGFVDTVHRTDIYRCTPISLHGGLEYGRPTPFKLRDIGLVPMSSQDSSLCSSHS